MKLFLQTLAVFSITSSAAGQHITPPEELDVESPPFCTTNSAGFGGAPISGDNVAESTFYYELVTNENGASDMEATIFEVERRIADYLLSETPYFSGCGSRRRVKAVRKTGLRKLQDYEAIAITTNPTDYVIDDVQCTDNVATDGQTCVVVGGAYQVYFAEGAVDTGSTMESLENEVEKGMDDDKFTGGDVEKVTWKSRLSDNTGDAANEADSPTVRSVDNSGNSMPVIVGASIGGIVAIGLLAFYRRRNLKNNDDDTFNTPHGGSTMTS
eukprot:CAMPEP_0176022108 /NCGR_PEP_ID=MMETSP0120_2-20121206/10754_1 /TAXON_ID=160619 /ORGANISM="Kryptoperidinium foliaceum, Strain CCMP 1326" /LENGTH=269 /DNA_ID=CAMNT_0017355241 /DNA_START=223 /DNA_END=1032 /DNA_ORIENTATION=+